MRPVRHEDVHAAARVLLGVASGRRVWVLYRMLREAGEASLHGISGHPVWGDGSLMTAALRRRPCVAPALADRGFCECLALVYWVLSDQPVAQETQVGMVGSSFRRPSGISSPQS